MHPTGIIDTMSIRIIINGQEIEHPLVKFTVSLLALIVFVVFSALLVFIILPLIGITLVVSLGIFIAVFLGVSLSLLVAMLIFKHTGNRQ